MRHPARIGVVASVALAIAGCATAGPSIPGTVVSPVPSTTTAPSAPGSAAADPSSSPSWAAVDLGILVGSVPGGRILFGIEQGGRGTIATVILDSDGLHPIEPIPDHTMANAAWLGQDAIVFDVEHGDHRNLFRMALAGGEAIPLTDDPTTGEEKAGVSADGSTIAYEHYVAGTNRDLGIQVASPVDATPHGLPAYRDPVTGGDTEVALSPDGQWLAFIRIPDWNAHRAALFVVPSRGGTPRRLTSEDMDAGHPRWSPDGKTILFTQGLHGGAHDGPLWVVPAAGGTPTKLADPGDGRWAFEADWSPDGSHLVYKAHEAAWDHNELWIAAADGTDARQLWVGGHEMTAETPDWGP